MLRWWIYILPVVIIIASGVGYFWYDETLAVFGFLLLNVRRFSIRYGTRKLFLALLMPALPVIWRRYVRFRIEQWDELRLRLRTLWSRLPLPMRWMFALPIFLCASFIVIAIGGILGILSLGPAQWAASLLFGGWFRNVVLPILGRIAAARGLENVFPTIVASIPLSIRTRIRRVFMWLWWRTMRKIVRGRIGIVRRSRRRRTSAPRKVDGYV